MSILVLYLPHFSSTFYGVDLVHRDILARTPTRGERLISNCGTGLGLDLLQAERQEAWIFKRSQCCPVSDVRSHSGSKLFNPSDGSNPEQQKVIPTRLIAAMLYTYQPAARLAFRLDMIRMKLKWNSFSISLIHNSISTTLLHPWMSCLT